jgi:cbb3-type cytochrome oxidase subunit 3
VNVSERALNLCGWVGGGICLLAYGLMVQEVLSSSSLTFLLMNFTGCICLIYYTFRKGAFANAALNTVHLTITVVALARRLIV